MTLPKNADVVVVGAGPTGLTTPEHSRCLTSWTSPAG